MIYAGAGLDGAFTGRGGGALRPHLATWGLMQLSWIVIAELELDAFQSVRENPHLAVSKNPGFLKDIGIITARAYRPWSLKPGITVWQEIARRINTDFDGKARGRTRSLELSDASNGKIRKYTFNIRMYRPNILAIEVRMLGKSDVELTEAFSHRQLENHRSASYAVDIIIGIVKSHSTISYGTGNSFISRPVIYLPVDVDPEEFLSWKAENKRLIASLAINNKQYNSADESLADKIFELNKDVDAKYSKHAFSIINKQGIVTACTNREVSLPEHMLEEHEKRTKFLELALATRAFVSEFQNVREYSENLADFLYFLACPMLEENATLSKSVNGTHVWKLLSKELAFAGSIENVNPKVLAATEEKFEYFSRLPESDFDSFDFDRKANDVVRKYGKSFFDLLFDKKKWIIGILGIVLAAITLLLKLTFGTS